MISSFIMAVACMRIASISRFFPEGSSYILNSKSTSWVLSKNVKLLGTVASEEKNRNIPESSLGSEREIDNQLKTDVEKLQKNIITLEEKNRELDDKYKRALAEGDNMRKRLMKQVEDAKLYGIQGFCKDLLEVSDVLGQAIESVPKKEISDSNPYLKSLYEGLIMTEAQLQNVYRRHGLVPVNPLNEKFDPNMHEALFQQETSAKEPGTVVIVSKIGYKLHDRVVRPALVGVVKGS